MNRAALSGLLVSVLLTLAVCLGACGGSPPAAKAAAAAAAAGTPAAHGKTEAAGAANAKADEATADGAKADAGKADAANDGSGETEKAVTYPVVLVRPASRSFKQLVHGFGTVLPDARTARSVSSATMVEIRSVEVLPGERVKQGQPLFRVAADPLAYLAYQQAATAARLAKAELDRLKVLHADSLATATQVETAEKALADAQAGVEAARRQGASGETELLRAPVDGIVTVIAAAVGDRPAPGTSIATIAPPLATRVTLGIEPGEQRLVHVGDRVTVRAVQTTGQARTGRVAVVAASLDKETRLVTVSVALDPVTAPDLLSGLAVEGVIETRAIDAFSVPRSAIVKDEEGTAIFEVTDGKAHRVPVVIESEEGVRVGVSGALDPARPVVTIGAYELEDGVAVAEQTP